VVFSFELVNAAVARPANNVTLACGAGKLDFNEDGNRSTTSTNSSLANGSREGSTAGSCAPAVFPPRTAAAAALRVRDLPPPVCAQPRAFGPPACTSICQGTVAGGACLCPPRRFGDDCGRTSDPDKTRSTTGLVRGGAMAALEGGGGDGVEIPAGGLAGDVLVSVEVFPLTPEHAPGQVMVCRRIGGGLDGVAGDTIHFCREQVLKGLILTASLSCILKGSLTTCHNSVRSCITEEGTESRRGRKVDVGRNGS
jgi:hypothetical protein